MKLTQMKKAAELCFASNVTMALVGTSGVGKTSIVKQLAVEMGFDSYRILRPSLVADVGDLIGLPDFDVIIGKEGKEEKRTTFNAPDWLPTEDEEALIIIDEINRTQKDIVMAMFDLIEAEHPKIGNYILPKGCKVIATLNPPTDNYTVLDFRDSAFTSRLCFIKVVPNLKVFTDWGRKGNLSDEMMDFLNKNDKFFGIGEDFEVDDFFGANEGERGDHFKNNNRSKKKVSDLYENAKKLRIAKGISFECIRGIAGLEAATAYTNFADTYKNVVTLEDLLNDKTSHKKFEYGMISNVSKILDDLKVEIAKVDLKDKQIDNLVLFLNKIPLDTLNGFANYIQDIKGDSPEELRLEKFTEYLGENSDLMERLDHMIELKDDTEEEVNEETTES